MHFTKVIRSKLVLFFAAAFVVYSGLASLIEPFGWFYGEDILKRHGKIYHVLLFLIPLAIIISQNLYLLWKNKNLGITSFSTGVNRSEAFQNIRNRAKHSIFILGIGMTNLSSYAQSTLKEQADRIPIDILMIDPDFLERNKEFSDKLEEFLNIPDFHINVRRSFETIKKMCMDWNNSDSRHKMRFRVYDTIPTASMVMIDHEHDAGEIVVEFFIFNSGERRPLLECKKIDDGESLYEILKMRYLELWSKSKEIVK